MANKMTAGGIAFMVGFFGAILVGILQALDVFTAGVVVTTILIIAGLIIGFFNVKAKEAVAIMVSALVLGGGAGILSALPAVGGMLSAILESLAKVLLPVGIVVAFETFRKKGQ